MNVKKTENGFRKVNKPCPYHCNNGKLFIYGQGLVDCPQCSGIAGFMETFNETDTNNVFDSLKIPKNYRNCDGLVAQQFVANVPKVMYKYGVDTRTYCTVLSGIQEAIDFGSLYKASVLIRELPTANLDLNQYIYGIMINAVQRGIGVLPYISLNDLRVLRYNDDLDRNKFNQQFKTTHLMRYNIDGITGMSTPLMLRCKYAIGVDYYDYKLAPLVFIDAGTLATANELSVLQELMSERARHDLPTYVTMNPRAGTIHLDEFADTLYDNMLTTTTYRMDKLLPVDYYKTGTQQKVQNDVESLLQLINKDNDGVSGNIVGFRQTTDNNIMEDEYFNLEDL